MAERGSTVNRIRNAGMTKRDIANGKLPASWLSASERAIRANPGARALSAKVAERMIANPEAVASKLASVRMGAIDAARVKNYKTAALVAAGAALVAGVAALKSKPAKADDGKAAPARAPGSHYAALDVIKARGLAKHPAFNSFATDLANSNSAEANRLSERIGAATERTQTHLMNYAHLRAKADEGKGASAKPAAPPATAPAPADKASGVPASVNAALGLFSLIGAGVAAGMRSPKLAAFNIGAAAMNIHLAGSKAMAPRGGAYLNDAAKAAAERTPGTPSGTAPPAPAAPSGPAPRSTYVTVDGKTVEGTEAEIRTWQNRRAQ